MKGLASLVILLVYSLTLNAQNDIPPYRKVPYFPPVKILLADSVTWYQKDDLPKKTPVLLFYFNPECDHCQQQIEEIVNNIGRFKNIHLVMVTSQHFDKMKGFIERYHLAEHSNIVMGFDPGFFLMHFYQVHHFPFLAFYNKWKELISAYNGGLPLEKILKEFEQ